MQTALLLIALGFGFKIFSDASEKQKKSVKQLGRVVGVVMMALSFLGSICTTLTAIKTGGTFYPMFNCPTHGFDRSDGYGDYHGSMGMAGKKMMCPIAGQMKDDTAETGNLSKK